MLAGALLAQADTSSVASAVLFYVFAAMAGVSAIGVVVSRNIVRTAVLLLFALLGVGGLFFLLDAEFLAAVQLVVYAGATLILIIFGVMLTSKSPFSRFEAKRIEVVTGLVIGAVLLAGLIGGILALPARPAPPAAEAYSAARLGNALLGDYLVPFELASVLLLVTMIGAAYLAKGRRGDRDGRRSSSGTADLSQRARQWS